MATREEVEAMLARMALGDRTALSALYGVTCDSLFGIAVQVLDDRSEAEDALQEIYIKIWRNAGRYRPGDLSPMSWLIAIARNHALDKLRARIRRRSRVTDPIDTIVDLADPSPSPEEAMLAASILGALRDCLAELRPLCADAVCRAYIDGESYADLAIRYDVPLNTIRTWLRRSLLQLRKGLG